MRGSLPRNGEKRCVAMRGRAGRGRPHDGLAAVQPSGRAAGRPGGRAAGLMSGRASERPGGRTTAWRPCNRAVIGKKNLVSRQECIRPTISNHRALTVIMFTLLRRWGHYALQCPAILNPRRYRIIKPAEHNIVAATVLDCFDEPLHAFRFRFHWNGFERSLRSQHVQFAHDMATL